MLDNIHIILIETSHPGNIGAVARAMKNMGVTKLRLVNPLHFPHPEATARSAGADDLLKEAVCYKSLEDAVQNCNIVIGVSARMRGLEWPLLTIDQDADFILKLASRNNLAIVFGRESSGLSNAELQYCNYQLMIKAHPQYTSLNLAAAVQIIVYELYIAVQNSLPITAENNLDLATSAELESFYQHLQRVALESGYFNLEKPGRLMQRFRKLYNRIMLTKTEINILRGFLKAVQNKVDQG